MNSRRFLPVLLLLFVGSGCAALISEVVWFQLLQLVIGSSAVSLGVLLGTFMGRLCLGSLVVARAIPARHHHLRVYALIELGIGRSVGSALARDMARPRIALGWCQALLCGAIAWTACMPTDSLPYWPIDLSLSLSPWFNIQDS